MRPFDSGTELIYTDIRALDREDRMNGEIRFIEKRMSWGIVIILSVFTAAILFWFLYQLINGPVGTKPAPNWFLGVMSTLFILLTINFSSIHTVISPEGIRVKYGLFGCFRSWEQIKSCEEDDKKHFYGWGIRFGKYKGKWVWVYNVIGGTRVAFISRNRKPRGLIISTRRAEEMIKAANSFIS